VRVRVRQLTRASRSILVHRMHDEFEKMEATAHLNTCLKHFVFFALEFKLLDAKETDALKGPIAALTADWKHA